MKSSNPSDTIEHAFAMEEHSLEAEPFDRIIRQAIRFCSQSVRLNAQDTLQYVQDAMIAGVTVDPAILDDAELALKEAQFAIGVARQTIIASQPIAAE